MERPVYYVTAIFAMCLLLCHTW